MCKVCIKKIIHFSLLIITYVLLKSIYILTFCRNQQITTSRLLLTKSIKGTERTKINKTAAI